MLYNNIPRGFGNFFLKQLQMLFYVFVPNERTTITLFLCWVSGNVPLEKNLKLRSSEMSFPAFRASKRVLFYYNFHPRLFDLPVIHDQSECCC